MAIYRYPHESLVDSVQILTNEKGGLRAYLYADNGADTEKLRILKQSLRAQGYKCVPMLNGDKPVLEVRGFKKSDELMGYLGQMGALKGKPEVIAEEGDKRTRKQKFENATLKAAGISFNIGDIAYMYYAGKPVLDKMLEKEKGVRAGFKATNRFDWLDVLSGVGYALGSSCLTFFGSKDQSINTITSATSKIERFARKEGYQIAPESSISFVNEKKDLGTWGNIKHMVGRYPSESLNAIYVGVGACITAAAYHRATKPVEIEECEAEATKLIAKTKEKIKELLSTGKPRKLKKAAELEQRLEAIDKNSVLIEEEREQKWDKIDVGLGAVTAAAAITGLAVKEQKRVDGDPKRHGIGGVVDWVREKPLRATGYGFMLATLFHAAATAGKWSNRKVNGKGKDYLVGRGIFIATNLFSERLMAISSKGHGEGVKPDSSVDESILSTAAELVLRQPADKREAVISQLSGYIASPEVLAVKADKIEASIRHHIAKLDENPWTKHYVPTATGEMVEAPLPSPAIATPAPANDALPVQLTASKPLNVVTSPEYLAKQQVAAHAVA